MIDYEDDWHVLISKSGSVLPKAFMASVAAPVLAVIILLCDDYFADFRKVSGIEDVNQSFMWNAMTAIIAILLGFRTKQALGRFWEGTGLLHQMRGEWFDASSCLMTFSRDGKVNKGKAMSMVRAGKSSKRF